MRRAQLPTARALTTFAACAVVAGCTLKTSLSDLTGGVSVDGGADVTVPDAPDDVVSEASLAESDVADVADAGDAGDAGIRDAAQSYSSIVLGDNPVAYFRLGETTGTVARNESSPAQAGTYVGQLTLGVPGAISGDSNTAVELAGTSGAIPVGDAFDFAGNAPFTVEMWIKATLVDGKYRSLFTKRVPNDGGNFEGYWMYVRLTGLTPTLQFETIRDGAYDVVSSPLAPGVFHHVVVTQDAARITLVVDGEEAQVAPSPKARIDNATPSILGAEAAGGGYFAGVLDEVVVYDRVLPFQRARAHHAAGRAVTDGG